MNAELEPEQERHARRGVAVGFLAMVPLFATYEIGVALGGSASPRNTSELLLGAVLVFLDDHATAVRVTLLVGLALWAFVHARIAGVRILRAVLRTFLEGVACAVALGPLLLLLVGLFGLTAADLHLDGTPPGEPPELGRVARLAGAGAWEEIVFRVGVYSLVFVLALRGLRALGIGRPEDGDEEEPEERGGPARWMSDATALVLSSLAFAAFHLDSFTRFLGVGGESFDGAVFAWRACAGACLALIFRWRGPGVCAWGHGLFNLALVLGAGPGVLD